MRQCKCSKYEKFFEQTVNPWVTAIAHAVDRVAEAPLCFLCALDKVTPADRGPEGSDLTTASILSGEMSDADARQMQEDARAAEEGRSPRELPRPGSDEDEDESELTEEDWGYCPDCHKDKAFCLCVCPICGDNPNYCSH